MPRPPAKPPPYVVRPGVLGCFALVHAFLASPLSVYVPCLCLPWIVLHQPLLLTWPLYLAFLLVPYYRKRSFIIHLAVAAGFWLVGAWPYLQLGLRELTQTR